MSKTHCGHQTTGSGAEGGAVLVEFRFETSRSGGYVPILGNSSLGPTKVASQDAGSRNPGIYYQVGGDALNGKFASDLTKAGQLPAVNQALVRAYDNQYGTGSWQKWNRGEGSGRPPLTSFLIALEPGVGPIGSDVVGLMYSVGPKLSPQGITDTSRYRAIYTAAMTAIGSGGLIDGLRITMLSTGIYADRVTDKKKLYVTAAESIIDGIVSAVADDPTLAGVMVLINTSDTDPVSDGQGKERYGFCQAAKNRGIKCNSAGFDVVAAAS